MSIDTEPKLLTIGDIISDDLSGVLVEDTHIENILKESDTSLCTRKTILELSKEKRLVLYFYPKDSTPGCTIEANQFQKYLLDFHENNTIIVGCSRDNEQKHSKFIKNQNLTFPLLYDDTGKITESFGVWKLKKFMGREYMGIDRVTFIIQAGKIIQVYSKVKVKIHAEEILDFIKSI